MADKIEKIKTVDEYGNDVSFEVLDIVTVDDIEYAVLLPDGDEQEDAELLVMRLKQDGDEYMFEVIEDEAEFERVSAFIEKMEEEMDD